MVLAQNGLREWHKKVANFVSLLGENEGCEL